MSLRGLALAAALLVASGAGAQSQAPDPTKEAGRINARLSMEYLKRGQLQVAQEKIEKALQQNPHDVNVQLSAGLVYERLLENKKAEKHYRQAVREQPDSPEALNALATFLCRNDQQAKGEEMFLKAAANPIYRTPFVAYTNAGVCARSAGRLEQAERYLRQALTFQVDYPETYAQLAGVLHERGSDLQARAAEEMANRNPG
jgi:type IV pilus assembly protein PilF